MEKHIGGLGAVTPDGKMLCRVEEAAAMLSIGRTAAWELVRTHKLKSVKIGRTRRVPLQALEEYIQQLMDEEAA
jgi:excisionase family DNA binding protein